MFALLSCAQSPGVAQDPAAPPSVLEDFCPFEYGCDFGGWVAGDSMPVYAERGDRDSRIDVLPPGACIQTLGADMVVDEPGLVVVRRAFDGFEPGDTLHVLSYAGEGYYAVWHDGEVRNIDRAWPREPGTSVAAQTMSIPRFSYWVRFGEPDDLRWIALRNISNRGIRFDLQFGWDEECNGAETVGAARVRHGETFEAPLPDGLVFRLRPASHPQNPQGWRIEVVDPDAPDDDYSLVATPPYRFSNPRYVDTGYGLTPEAALAWSPREFRFVTNRADYERAQGALGVLLWQGEHTEEEVQRARATHASIYTRRALLWIEEGSVREAADGEAGLIEWMQVRLELYQPPPKGH
ncbi:MAG: hypothetical protein ABFS34_05095 [Gemmatimonadota bacterium]